MMETSKIFVVGSGRSGTTMMGRILGNHSKVFTFNEIHFLGWLRNAKNMQEVLDKQSAVALLSELFARQKDGIFLKKDPKYFFEKSQELLSAKNNLTAVQVYAYFLQIIPKENQKIIACEQTPKNIFYIPELLSEFPDARFIHMVRDSRDVLLSQKNKWRRRFLGASTIPIYEAIRSFMNYHPITSAKFWNSAVSHGRKMEHHPRVMTVRFEDVLQNPEKTIQKICDFIGMDFESSMLAVPNIGSSTQEDESKELKIDNTKTNKWQKGGINDAEIFLSQLITKKNMQHYHYPLKTYSFPPISALFYLIILPIKSGMALLLNLKRISSISEMIKQRFQTK